METWFQLRAHVPYLGDQFVGWIYSDHTRALALALALRSCPGAPYQVLTQAGQPVLDTSAIPGLPGFGTPPGGYPGAGGGGAPPYPDHPYGLPAGTGQPDWNEWLQQQLQNYQQYIPQGWPQAAGY